jgi:hypothetical protein
MLFERVAWRTAKSHQALTVGVAPCCESSLESSYVRNVTIAATLGFDAKIALLLRAPETRERQSIAENQKLG